MQFSYLLNNDGSIKTIKNASDRYVEIQREGEKYLNKELSQKSEED